MKNKGFTLIELMVVMVVIAILVGVALPRIKGMRDEANQSKAKTELKSIQAAIESYYINESPNAYPDTTSTICDSELNDAAPLIVGEVLYDPFAESETEYEYIRSDNELYYVVFSVGVNGEADITGIDDEGVLDGSDEDDLYASNGIGWDD